MNRRAICLNCVRENRDQAVADDTARYAHRNPIDLLHHLAAIRKVFEQSRHFCDGVHCHLVMLSEIPLTKIEAAGYCPYRLEMTVV